MGLRDAIPGLVTHKTVVSVSFDNEAAANAIRTAVSDVNASFPCPDAWIWLVANRPDVISELKKCGNDMNVAYQAQSLEQVSAAADRFVRAHKRAWILFEERPPIVERQEALFLGAN
jgi:hypothetical protein